jgi:ketosteroid isomerase-like protein
MAKTTSTAVRTPVETVAQLVEAINQGRLDEAVALYEPQGVLVTQQGKAVGTPALREALAGFIALKPTLITEFCELIQAGDTALYCSRWSLRGTDPAGKTITMSGRSADVLRRQPNGNWLIAVDNPWGTDILPK